MQSLRQQHLHKAQEDCALHDLPAVLQAAELGVLAKVFNQDTFNLPQVQAGLMAAQYDEVVLARYQETKIRHFHHLLGEWLSIAR